ncbi:MAG: AbrB/MazE/SpoVT family DNA-binding domain-containing protein [Patescibacteria group bacterium]
MAKLEKNTTLSLTKLRPKAQITLPKEIINKLELNTGDLFEVEITKGKIVLEPKVLISKEEAWLNTLVAKKSLQRGLNDLKKGQKFGPFKNAKDLVKSLNS